MKDLLHFYGSKSFTFWFTAKHSRLFSSSHKRQNLLPHHLEREPVLWLSEADRMPQKRWHASSEPKPRGALSTVLVSLLQPWEHRWAIHVAGGMWNRTELPQLPGNKASLNQLTEGSETGQNWQNHPSDHHRDMWAAPACCMPQRRWELCVYSIIVAIGNWHNLVRNREWDALPGKIIRSNFHLQIRWVLQIVPSLALITLK